MSTLEQSLDGPAIEVLAKATRRRFTLEGDGAPALGDAPRSLPDGRHVARASQPAVGGVQLAEVLPVHPAPAGTLRDRLLKLAAWVQRSVRRIVLHLPTTYPWLAAWRHIAVAVGAAPA